MARPSPRALVKNFDSYDGSLQKKVGKAVTNSLKKVVTVSECCGNHDEPGC